MAQFDDIFRDVAVPTLLEHAGDEVVYAIPGESARTRTCLVSPLANRNDREDRGREIAREIEVLIPIDENDVVGIPQSKFDNPSGHTLTWRSTAWDVMEVLQAGPNMVRIRCERCERQTLTGRRTRFSGGGGDD